jgi:hypothetical protein
MKEARAASSAAIEKAIKMDPVNFDSTDVGGVAEPRKTGFRIDAGAVLLALFVVFTAYILSR